VNPATDQIGWVSGYRTHPTTRRLFKPVKYSLKGKVVTMKTKTIHFTRPAAMLACAIGLTACLNPQALMAADSLAIPAALKVPAGNQVVLETFVTEGVQTYKCAASYTYEFLGPTAMLRGTAGQYVVHFFGPRFDYHDGSGVLVKLVASAPRDNAIAELLLKVAEHKGPAGAFSPVNYIQCLQTSGGIAPAHCNPAVDKKPLPVPYFARYRFWAPKP
jgi:hypothetical protein